MPSGQPSRVFEILYNKFYRPYGNAIMVLGLVILFIVVANYGYKRFYLNKPNTDYSNVSSKTSIGGDIHIYYFFADWCPHCQKSKGDWMAFKSEYDGKTVNGHKIGCTQVDCSDRETPAALQTKYGIKQYPTILAVKKGNGDEDEIKYDSKITKTNLETFVREICK